MKLGFFIINETHKAALLGLTRAALSRGWEVRWFFSDHGTQLLADEEVAAHCLEVAISFCEYSAKKLNVPLEKLPKKIKKGTQLNNAFLHQHCEKIVTL